MSNKSDEELREQIREMISEFEKKGVSLQMIMDCVNSLVKNKN